MKRIIPIFILIAALGTVDTASADPVDILFGGDTYTVARVEIIEVALGLNFLLTAVDRTITLSDGSVWDLTGTDATGNSFQTRLYIDITRYEDGSFTGSMQEKVVPDSADVQIGSVFFPELTILLEGEVVDFGWQLQSTTATFSFLIGSVGGGLVDEGFWTTDYSTRITATAHNLQGWDGTWTPGTQLLEIEGHKTTAVPEPNTMLLLGCGLAALASLRKYRC